MIGGNLIPSRLYRIKTFISMVETRTAPDEPITLREDPTIEEQVDAWVTQDKVLIVGTGPLTVTETLIDNDNSGELVLVLRKTLAVIYVPPVEEGDQIYGENEGSTQPVSEVDVGAGRADADDAGGGDGPGAGES